MTFDKSFCNYSCKNSRKNVKITKKIENEVVKMISLEEFDKIDMRVGTIIEAKINKGARKPAYKLKIDLGKDLGIKNSSAQLTELYTPEDLVGKQVIVVVNFNPIRIADIKSEVRILGAENKEGCIILTPERQAQNGSKIY